MPLSKVEFSHLFLQTMPAIEEEVLSEYGEYKAAFEAQTTGQNPQQASAYAQKQLEQIEADEQMLQLYDSIVDLASEIGEGLFEDMPIVERAAAIGLRLASRRELTPAITQLMAKAMGQAVAEDRKRRFLANFLKLNATKVQEHRMAHLENSARFGRYGEESNVDEDSTSGTGFTLAQQALALQFLLTEGMDVSGVDQTKVIALAHLLSGKKIPIRNGKENIGNSGIKTAFAKIREKQDKHRLSDLRFVLRFFKPFEHTSSEGMNRIIQAIEKEIAKTEERLRKEER